MSESELIAEAQKFSIEHGLPMSLGRARKIARAVAKRIEREEHRKYIGWFETSDDYSPISYSDRVGEEAVRNVLAEMLLSGTPAK